MTGMPSRRITVSGNPLTAQGGQRIGFRTDPFTSLGDRGVEIQ